MGIDGHTERAAWFLTAAERGNPATRLDTRPDGIDRAWRDGNEARPLLHGAAYFRELYDRIEATGPCALICFTDWQGDPDQRLTDDPGSSVAETFGRAVERGVDMRALIWRSHSGALGYATGKHRRLGDLLQRRGADVQLDMRVRPGGAHHQKFVVIRHARDADRDIAFVGGIDLCHGRRDDAGHLGDPQADALASEYGDRPPWHDVQVALQGPVVHDVETVFRERWDDATPLTRNPLRRLRDALRGLHRERRPLPPQAPPPPPRPAGHRVQLLRTYPKLGLGWAYDFAPQGERSVARGYAKAVRRTRSLIYVEDQFLWGRQMSEVLVDALESHPGLHLIGVLPQFPDQDGWFARDPQVLGRLRALRRVYAAAPDRVAFYGLENHAGTPVYVHAKVCVLDDWWASIGSDNFCRRPWTHDSELSAVVIDPAGEGHSAYARELRLALAAEHLDVEPGEVAVEAAAMFAQFARAAERLEAWHRDGRQGPRPAGRLRRLPAPSLPLFRQAFAAPWYRYLHDPDGRPAALRRHRTF
ncbi:MAG: phospholipase [Aeromicrobium sp.]|uniref:phospholipase D family protein n=1 Tax=Aeromicrobium sp. TaxID=1871063 RepID=UPI0039E71282